MKKKKKKKKEEEEENPPPNQIRMVQDGTVQFPMEQHKFGG